MKLSELHSRIIRRELDNLYIFTGEEIGITKIYIDQIAKLSNLPIVRKETTLEVSEELQLTGFFETESKLYVVRGDKSFQKEDKVWASFKSAIKGSIVILLYDKVDSRLKFGKFFKENIVEFEKLDRKNIVKYIKKESGLSDKAANKLSEICGDSYDIAMLECNKVLSYCSATGKTADNALETLVMDNNIMQNHNIDVFVFSKCVCLRHRKQALLLAKDLVEQCISTITILGTLYSSMRAVMLIQCCESKNIAEITGLDKGSIWYNKNYVGYYSTEELVFAVKTIAKAIESIKAGKLNDNHALFYVLVSIL